MADIMASVLFIFTQNWPHGIFADIDPSVDFFIVTELPYVFRGAPWMFFTGYLLTLSILTVNQYVGVCHPWRYAQLITRKSINRALLIIWLISSLQILVPMVILIYLSIFVEGKEAKHALFVWSSMEMQIWMIVFMFSTLFNIVFDICVYFKIRELKQSCLSINQENVNAIDSINIRMKNEAFITSSLLLGASVFCRLPFPLVSIIFLQLGNIGCHLAISMKSMQIINAIVIFMLYLNFLADPIIYLIRVRETRRAAKTLLGRMLSFRERRRCNRDYGADGCNAMRLVENGGGLTPPTLGGDVGVASPENGVKGNGVDKACVQKEGQSNGAKKKHQQSQQHQQQQQQKQFNQAEDETVALKQPDVTQCSEVF